MVVATWIKRATNQQQCTSTTRWIQRLLIVLVYVGYYGHAIGQGESYFGAFRQVSSRLCPLAAS